MAGFLIVAQGTLAAPQFHVVGMLSGSPAIPSALSADGSVAVGTTAASEGNLAFRWTLDGGAQSLGILAGGIGSAATGVSADGSVVVGNTPFANQHDRGFRWTAFGGLQDLGVLAGMTYSSISGLSANGTLAVGNSGNLPVQWTQEVGMQSLGTLPGFLLNYAVGVSGDGNVAVGYATSGGSTHATRWTNGGNPQDLGVFDGDYANAIAASFDGSKVAGNGLHLPFRWTPANGMQSLGLLPGTVVGHARSISADGNTIVGDSNPPGGWVWSSTSGLRSITDVLAPDGTVPSGWTDLEVFAISADGQTLAGYGKDEHGQPQGWVAHLGGPQLVTLDLTSFTGMPNTPNAIVPLGGRLSNQFLYTKGILFSSGAPFAAIVNVGLGVAPVGSTALMSAAPNNRLSLNGTYPVRGVFFSPNNGITPAVTDYISVQADLVGGAGSATLTAFGLDGSMIATKTASDSGGEILSIIAPGIHRWEFSGDGTIYIGNIRFDAVTPHCAGDLTLDSMVDDADFVFFAIAYDLLLCNDPMMPPSCSADLNGDGVVDDLDFVVFAAAYDQLICP